MLNAFLYGRQNRTEHMSLGSGAETGAIWGDELAPAKAKGSGHPQKDGDRMKSLWSSMDELTDAKLVREAHTYRAVLVG